MAFIEMFSPAEEDFVIESFEVNVVNELDEKTEKDFNLAGQLLRDNGIKIRLETRTAFGTQIDLATDYNKKELEKILKNYDVKMKGRSLFVS